MVLDTSVKVTDLAIVMATFLGPVFAVWSQGALERRRARRNEQQRLFNVLMGTRATWLSPVRVETLNSIPIVFYGAKRAHKDVIQAWRDLLHHFDRANSPEWKDQGSAWESRRLDLEIAMLRRIGACVGYDFPELDLKTLHYFPTGLGDRIGDETAIRRGLADLLSGKKRLPLDLGVQETVAKDHASMLQSLARILGGKDSLPVDVQTPSSQPAEIQPARGIPIGGKP
ncbi:hypothetical protein ADM96_08225 [Burkholderia sp. ST111]|nr:hypothetical protein ADM96_08225 [Burkholderia sp. ST111]